MEIEPAADRIRPERRPHRPLLEDLDGSGQRSGPEHDGQVRRLLRGEPSGDLGPAGRDALADDRRGVHVAVQHDGQSLAHVGFGEVAERLATARVELERHVGLAGVLVDRDARGGEIATGQVCLLAEHEGRPALDPGLLVDPALVERLEAFGHRAGARRRLRIHLVIHQLELEQRRLADEGLGPLGILHAGQLDQDAVLPLLLDRRLRDAELVDPVADGLEPLSDGEVSQGGDLARLHRQDGAPGRLVAFLHLEATLLPQHGLRVGPGLRRGELDDELGGAAALDLGHADALFFEAVAHRVAHPIYLGLDRLVDVHAQHEVDAALEVEAEVDALAGRVEVPDRDGDHRDDDADAEGQILPHQFDESLSPETFTMRPSAERSKSILTESVTLSVMVCSLSPTTVP